jgi:hypothetical protein
LLVSWRCLGVGYTGVGFIFSILDTAFCGRLEYTEDVQEYAKQHIVSVTGLTLGGSEFAGHFVLYQKSLGILRLEYRARQE